MSENEIDWNTFMRIHESLYKNPELSDLEFNVNFQQAMFEGEDWIGNRRLVNTKIISNKNDDLLDKYWEIRRLERISKNIEKIIPLKFKANGNTIDEYWLELNNQTINAVISKNHGDVNESTFIFENKLENNAWMQNAEISFVYEGSMSEILLYKSKSSREDLNNLVRYHGWNISNIDIKVNFEEDELKIEIPIEDISKIKL